MISRTNLEQIDYVSGYVVLMQFTADDQDPYYVVRVAQYGEDLEYIKVLSLPEAKSTQLRVCEEYKEKLSQGRPYIEFQLAEREDGLWEFQSDGTLPVPFYDFSTKEPGLRQRTFKSRDEAINFARTSIGRWYVSTEGYYDIVDRTGQVTRARSLGHIDWENVPRIQDHLQSDV